MSLPIAAESNLVVGDPLVLDAPSHGGRFGAVFEDDGETGYFYALDSSRKPNAILDALHIYDVSNVADRDCAARVQIVWSHDGLIAAFLVNSYPRAIFDFEASRGYCRTGFPVSGPDISQHDHLWDENAWNRMQLQA